MNVLEGVSTTTTFKKEFKISGQIGDSSQKARFSFTSLAHQINAGLNHGYKEEEVTEAVIRGVNPGMRITSYLEGKPHLTLANLRKIFRSRYQEKEVTEMYQLLSSGVQEGGETPRDFLVRLLDLKPKVLFASQEADSDLKYDVKLVQCMFLHSLLTGLRSDGIKLELKPCLQNTHVTDQGLFETCHKYKPCATCSSSNLYQGDTNSGVTNHPQKPTKPNLLTELQEMKVELTVIRESIGNQHRTTTPDQYRFINEDRARPRGCEDCLREGFGDRCTHCFICGRSGHFSYKCRRSQAQNWAYKVFQKFGSIVNCILRKAFNASLGKCKLIQVRNLSK